MSEFLTMMAMVVVGTVILVAGMRLNHRPERSHDGSVMEAASWGAGFFLSFTGQALLLSNF